MNVGFLKPNITNTLDRLFEKNIVNLEDFENFEDLICFVEQLLIVLNESHDLLQFVTSTILLFFNYLKVTFAGVPWV